MGEQLVYELRYRIGEKEYKKTSHDRQALHDKLETLQKNLMSPTGTQVVYLGLEKLKG